MSKIERDSVESENLVLQALIEVGYPKNSILLEGQLDSHRYVDFIVVDTDSNLPLMFIEVKSCSEKTRKYVKEKAFETLRRYYTTSNMPVKAVAAIIDRDKGELEFIDYTEAIKEKDYKKLIGNYKLPTYDTLSVGAQRKSIKQKEEQQTRNINVLKVLSWIVIPIICLGFLLLDAFEIYTFTTLRLIVIGVCIAIILLPCFKEIKIGEVLLKKEIEKEKNENEQNNKEE